MHVAGVLRCLRYGCSGEQYDALKLRAQLCQSDVKSDLQHGGADRLTHGDVRWVKAFEAMDVDAEVVWRHPLAVEWIDAADFAKEVSRGFGVELILGERLFARQQLKLTFMHFDHQRIFTAADAAITHGQFRKIRFDLKAHGTAVATSKVFLHRAYVHLSVTP